MAGIVAAGLIRGIASPPRRAHLIAAQQISLGFGNLMNPYYFPSLRATRRANLNRLPVVVTRTNTRVTWAAVTSGTPSCSTFAVMHISAIPPGAVARITLGTGNPYAQARTAPSVAARTSASSRLANVAATKPGIRPRKLRSNRPPSAQPISNWAAFETWGG